MAIVTLQAPRLVQSIGLNCHGWVYPTLAEGNQIPITQLKRTIYLFIIKIITLATFVVLRKSSCTNV